MESIQQIINEIKTELEQIKNFKHIEIYDYVISISNSTRTHPTLKKILSFIVKKLDLNVIAESYTRPSMNISFKDDPKKIYHLSIHFVTERDPSLVFCVTYYAPEHESLNCNRSDETIGELVLNDQSDEEIVDWFLSLRGKTKSVNCYYCGEINIHH